jgi:hypothetical protein
MGPDRRGHAVLLEREDLAPGAEDAVVGRNAYYILAHQYIAAKLNLADGASSTPAVTSALSWTDGFFAAKTPVSTLSKALRAQVIANAETMADYNEGDIGPGHCPD